MENLVHPLHSTTQRPRWNADVLEGMLNQAGAGDLYAAALVCRDWAIAARSALYRSLEYNTSRPNMPLLDRTLRSCPHLRVLVRFLAITMTVPSTLNTAGLDWLELLA